ncbi:hypothetical protein JCGZ_00483 [Jatropha curcas]|uniref:VQ domain-containing protein n=2 Tax=Jatropha curcas TaxID=180498 RepID=A0A067LFD1_JATCU|nr:hypothetical protein JCGZ_00483 [Jatropha curcas]
MSNPSDWGQFYNHQHNHTMFSDGVSDATVVTTTITSSTSPTLLGSGSSGSGSPTAAHLSPEGRVAKPVRRRSRASRRTPTTLLNTDTTNFRAMVQQFTGGPSAPFSSSGSHLTTSSFNFGMNPRQVHVNPMVPAAGYHNLQYQQQNQPSYLFSLGNNSPGNGDLFFQRLGNPRPTGMDVSSDGLVMDGVSAQQVAAPPTRPPPSSSNENRSNTFLF